METLQCTSQRPLLNRDGTIECIVFTLLDQVKGRPVFFNTTKILAPIIISDIHLRHT